MDEPKRILYRGQRMIEGWPEKIMAAQQIHAYTLRETRSPVSVTATNTTIGELINKPAMIAL